MTTEHPITPPPELVRTWMERTEYDEDTWFYESYIAEQAARWGANQELEACCEWIYHHFDRGLEWSMDLRTARRPKPPSLKEEALIVLDDISNRLDAVHENTIRRALEQLDD